MATRIEFPALPASVAGLPFLFMRDRSSHRDWEFNAALGAAIAAESAYGESRNSRHRIAYLLAELGSQYARRTGDRNLPVPLSRSELARALVVSLSKVKRILALLSLSGVIDSAGDEVRILDWRRLCALGGYDRARLGFDAADEDEFAMRDEVPAQLVTGAGDQAFFG